MIRSSKLFGLLPAVILLAAGAVSCNDDIIGGTGDDNTREETVVDNDSIDPEIFSLISGESVSAILALAEQGEYYYAAEGLLDYYRNRTSVVDPSISLIAPTITDEEQALADEALATEVDELIKSPTLEWTAAMGLAYRVSHDEDYAESWVSVMTAFIEGVDSLHVWNADDADARLDQEVSAWQYFMQSTAVTPAFTAQFLAYVGKDAAELNSRSTEAENGVSSLARVALVFPEFTDASTWETTGINSKNSKYEAEWFEALNLDAAGLEQVKAAYQDNDYQTAAEALLSYWRTRSTVSNPTLTMPTSISTTYQHYADMALRENKFRFYVKNYYEDENTLLPYSYLADDGVSINWQYWPTGDQEQRYQVNRHEWMPIQGQAYYVSKDEKYVEEMFEVYEDWLTQNPCPTVPVDFSVYPGNLPAAWQNYGWTWRGLETATRLLGQLEILEYIQESETLTSEKLLWYLYNMGVHADFIMNNYSSTSNHLITQTQAVASAGLLLPELQNADTWISSGTGKLNEEVEAQYYDDGWLMDGDFHYHISSIEDFRQVLLIANANDKSESVTYKENLRKMCDVVLNMTYPDYSSVNMTDTRYETWTKSVLKRNFTRYAELFPDDQAYLWMSTEGASGSVPENLIKNFPDCGYYVLRSGWTQGAIMMVLLNSTQTPNEQWHRQWDNNTFELYVNGRHFFQDSGCYTYNTGTNRSKYAATSAHNTLTLDGANVTTCRGEMLKSTTDGSTDILVLSNASYDNLTHRRTVFFVDRTFFVIVDDAYGSAAGTVNLNFHLPPIESSTSDVTVDTANNAAYTQFSDDNNLLVKTFSSETMTTTERTGFLSTAIDKSVDRKSYQVDVTKTADMSAVRYITIILPSNNPTSETVSASFPSDFSESQVSADVTVGTRTYNLSVNL